MTQDCLDSPSTADVSYRLPKGIHVTGADDKSDPAIEGMPWGYLFFHNKTARLLRRRGKIVTTKQFDYSLFHNLFKFRKFRS